MAATKMSPLRLYRSILTTHRRVLPPAHRQLGDEYVKEEFRAHQSAKPELVAVFMSEWANYNMMLIEQGKANQQSGGDYHQFGANMSSQALEDMNDDQRQQLMELRSAAYDPQPDQAEQAPSR